MRFIASKVPILGTLLHWLKVPFYKPEESAFFYKTVIDIIRHRLKTGAKRHDLIDLMIEAMTSDLSQENEKNDHGKEQFERDSALISAPNKDKKGKKDIDEQKIVATAMAMLVAGYDTTAQTLTFIG